MCIRDRDESNNALSSVEWSLTDDAGGVFVIDSSSGAISLSSTATLDYEVTTQDYSVTVSAAGSEGGVTLTATLALTIAVTNVLESLSVSDGDVGANSIEENSAVGTVVSGLNLVATDEANGTFSAVWRLTDDAGGLFQIVSTNGEISLAIAGVLDYEGNQTPYEVVVQAANGGASVTGALTLTIAVTNVLESLSVSDTEGADNTLTPDATVGTEVSNLALSVIDEGSNSVSVTWSLGGEHAGLFDISGDGVVTWNSEPPSLDSYTITVIATQGNVSGELAATVQVLRAIQLRLKLFLEGPL